jgi:hypothetical protein
VGDAGLVVQDGMDKRCPDEWVAERRLAALPVRWAGASRFCRPWTPADVTPPAAAGPVAELLDIDVDQGARVVVLVAADLLPGNPADPGEPADLSPDQDLVDRGRGDCGPRRDLHRAQPVLPPQMRDRADDRPGCPVRRVPRQGRRVVPILSGPSHR